MVDVKGYTEHAGGLFSARDCSGLIKLLTQVQRVFQRIDAGPFGCLHGVQGFNCQRHADFAGVFECDGDAIAYLAARPPHVGVLGFARKCAGQCANHQHQTGCVQRFGVGNGTAGVVQRGLPPRCIGCGEEAAPAVPRELHACVAQLGCNFFQSNRRDLVAPRADGADFAPCTLVDDAVQRPLLAHCCGVKGQPVVVYGKVTHKFISRV